MKKVFATLLLLIGLTQPGVIAQQNISFLLVKAEQRGDKLYHQFSYADAIDAYKKAIAKDPDNEKIQLKIAESYRKLNDPKEAAEWYGKVMNKEGVVESIYKLRYAEALTSLQEYEEAKKWYAAYQTEAGQDARPEREIAVIDEQGKMFKPKATIEIKKASFNSAASDFSPAYYKDEIVFVSARKGDKGSVLFNWDKSNYLDLYRVDSSGTVNRFYDKLNSSFHEGPLVFYDEGQKLIFTRNNYDKKIQRGAEGITRLKLYSTEWARTGWTDPKELPFVSNDYSVGHPAITTDGHVLYFISDMPGGYGGTDLYKVARENGEWGTPVNLGLPINTEGNEMFPFIANDKYLYFASNGHGGLGGLDLFGVDISKDKPGKVSNLGAPLNSRLDDFGLIVDSTGEQGYYSSNREGSRSEDDIYSFKSDGPLFSNFSIEGTVYDKADSSILADAMVYIISDGVKIDSTTSDLKGTYTMVIEKEGAFTLLTQRSEYKNKQMDLMTNNQENELMADIYLPKDYGFELFGMISEKSSGEKIADVKVTLIDNFTGEEVLKTKSTSEGVFAYDLKGKNLNDRISFQLKLEKEGYLGKVQTFNGTLDTPGRVELQQVLDLKLDKIEIGTDIGKVLHVNPIYFDLGKFNIRPDAAKELLKIVEIMKENPNLEIELGSHTDARGSASGNLRLSDKRAKASVDYIVSQGIEATRIKGRGYGETQLINRCADGVKCTEDEHQFNRRTEFKITKF